MFSEARFVKAVLREYELCVNLLGSRGRLWPASAPVGVPVGELEISVELEAPRLRPRAGAGSWNTRMGAGF